MADRADRETFELRGSPSAVESALVTVGEYAWCSFIAADRALVRCEQEHAAVCTALLRNLPGVTASNRTGAYAAIGLIGPRAKELLMDIDLNPSGQIVQEATADDLGDRGYDERFGNGRLNRAVTGKTLKGGM